MADKESRDYGNIVSFRLTDDEREYLNQLSKSLGVSRNQAVKQIIQKVRYDKSIRKTGDLLKTLESISAEQGRVNNNINQFAKHANQKSGIDNMKVMEEYNKLFSMHLELQNLLVFSLRNLYREIK